MKEYKSHKIVEAVEILKTERVPLKDVCVFYAKNGKEYYELLSKFKGEIPKDGCFYLVKSGDCTWWEPKEVFENGYSEVKHD